MNHYAKMKRAVKDIQQQGHNIQPCPAQQRLSNGTREYRGFDRVYFCNVCHNFLGIEWDGTVFIYTKHGGLTSIPVLHRVKSITCHNLVVRDIIK